MPPLVTCILPCRGRPAQTLAVAAALQERAGVAAQWVAVGTLAEQDLLRDLIGLGWGAVLEAGERLTYWQALARATEAVTCDAATGDDVQPPPILCCLANDLDPAPGWLANGIAAYAARFGLWLEHGPPGHASHFVDRGGLMGFAGDGHGPHHSCHFLIGRVFLAELGGWPVHYDHNFGDTELCERAQQLGRYGKATRAVLAHRHAGRGLAPRDEVYDEGARRWAQDKLTYQRRRAQWASA